MIRKTSLVAVFALAIPVLLAGCDEGENIATLALELSPPKLYGADGATGNPAANLLELDPTTGATLNIIGPIGYGVTGLAKSPSNGKLYGVTGGADPTAPGSLIEIDKMTGAGTLIGDEDPTFTNGAADITFASNGVLYGWSEAGDKLVTINTSTGLATDVGSTGWGTAGSGLAAKIPANTLYFTGWSSCSDLQIADKTTGDLTSVMPLIGAGGCFNINALAFSPSGQLFGVMSMGGGAMELITIDITTGVITTVGPTIALLDAIIFF